MAVWIVIVIVVVVLGLAVLAYNSLVRRRSPQPPGRWSRLRRSPVRGMRSP